MKATRQRELEAPRDKPHDLRVPARREPELGSAPVAEAPSGALAERGGVRLGMLKALHHDLLVQDDDILLAQGRKDV